MISVRFIIILSLILLFFNAFAQPKKNIYFRSAVSRSFNENIYSQSGFLLPVVVKGRVFVDVALGYKVQKPNGAINQYEFLTYTSGHRIALDSKLFSGSKRFAYKSYVLSAGIGYKRLWPILKQYYERKKVENKLFFGLMINVTGVLNSQFPYGFDSVISNSNKALVGYGSTGVSTLVAKPNLNFGLVLSYKLTNKQAKEAISISTETQLSLGRVYLATYKYKYDGIVDNFLVANRGYLTNITLTVPLVHFK